MKLLLDTHVVIWAALDSPSLSRRARAALEDETNELLVSAVSAYEIELKRERDPVLRRLPRDIETAVIANGYRWISLAPAQAVEAGRLPRHHGDPFDRMLIAQAFAEDAILLTSDRWFPAYGAPTLW